jgi:hypothetical protein
MNFAHLHLLLNHFPVIGTIIGVGLFVASLFKQSGDLRRSSLVVLAVMALLTIPTFLSGTGAQLTITGRPGVSDALIQRHEGAAILAFWFMEITGALAIVGLWQTHRTSRPARWNVLAVLLFSLVTVGLMARTGNTGGDIRHPELWTSPDGTSEGRIGSIVHIFEPTPAKYSHDLVFTKWTTAVLMDLHFFGLVLVIGTVGILNLRILGVGKQMPFAPLHRFLPWAMGGLAINVITGVLAYSGSPELYSYDAAFWLKILALMLLGFNLCVFYLTGIFNRVERLGANDDAPMVAKLIAGSSLVFWFAIIVLGRYIQLAGGTISSSSN